MRIKKYQDTNTFSISIGEELDLESKINTVSTVSTAIIVRMYSNSKFWFSVYTGTRFISEAYKNREISIITHDNFIKIIFYQPDFPPGDMQIDSLDIEDDDLKSMITILESDSNICEILISKALLRDQTNLTNQEIVYE